MYLSKNTHMRKIELCSLRLPCNSFSLLTRHLAASHFSITQHLSLNPLLSSNYGLLFTSRLLLNPHHSSNFRLSLSFSFSSNSRLSSISFLFPKFQSVVELQPVAILLSCSCSNRFNRSFLSFLHTGVFDSS